MKDEEQWKLVVSLGKDIVSALDKAGLSEDESYDICGGLLFDICSTLDQSLEETYLHEMAFSVADEIFDEGPDEDEFGLKKFSSNEFENLVCNARVLLGSLENTSSKEMIRGSSERALVYLERAEAIQSLGKKHLQLRSIAMHWLTKAKNA